MKREDLKKLSDPEYNAYAEDLSIWREGTIAMLPRIRKAQARARAAGNSAEVERLEARYQEILQRLAKP